MAVQRTLETNSITAPPGFWVREASHFPKPLTPLGSSLFLEGINRSFPKVFAEFGLLLDRFEFHEIGGYVYQAAKPFGVGDFGGGGMPPNWLLWLILRLHPAFRRRLARNKYAIRSGLDATFIDRWYNEWRPRLTSDIERWRAIELASLSDEELAAHLKELVDWTHDVVHIHFLLVPPYGFSLARLAFFCRDHLGYGDPQVMALLSGLSQASSEPALALARLAGHIQQDAALKEGVLAAAPPAVPALLAGRNNELAAALDDYLHRYGCRALSYELGEPSLDEQPQLVASLLQDELRSSADLQTEQERLKAARDEAKTASLAALPDEDLRTEFLAVLGAAERAYPIREDNEFYTVSVPLALCRLVVLDAAKRLTAKAAFAAVDDVFFLRFDELLAALVGEAADCTDLIASRRQDLTATASFDPPASYGREPPLPPLAVMSPETRWSMEALLYSRDKVFEPDRSNRRVEAGLRELKGVAAARGSYTGTARVILGEEQFDKLRQGDVLVCPITSPVWSILFAKVGALVTDSGGILSHPAIIAREYGIPAVVATGNATQLIADGQQIAVDGEAGVVRLLD